VVAPAQDVEARIAFLEAGADDVIDGGFDRGELESRVMALLIRSGKVRPELAERSSSSELVAFFSPKGGVGTTTLAVNTAVLLAGGGAAPPRPARTARSRPFRHPASCSSTWTSSSARWPRTST
jgi:hypothetical protein